MRDQEASASLRWRAPLHMAQPGPGHGEGQACARALMLKAGGTALPSPWRGFVRAGRASGSTKAPSRRGQSESSPGTEHWTRPGSLQHVLSGRPEAATEASPKRPGPVPGRLRSGRSPAAPGPPPSLRRGPRRGRRVTSGTAPAPLRPRRLRGPRPTAAVRAGPGGRQRGARRGAGAE